MRKSFLLSGSCMLLVCIGLSCYHFDHHDTSISISETKDAYKMSAWFDKNKTGKVHQYMDQKLGEHNNVSFKNAEIDAIVTLDDRTTFYIKSLPGDLNIKLEKGSNSFESYTEIKEMCEGIKAVIAEN
ncbi:MAG: hypothetical protein ABI861_10105 [Panacibacter sp.]